MGGRAAFGKVAVCNVISSPNCKRWLWPTPFVKSFGQPCCCHAGWCQRTDNADIIVKRSGNRNRGRTFFPRAYSRGVWHPRRYSQTHLKVTTDSTCSEEDVTSFVHPDGKEDATINVEKPKKNGVLIFENSIVERLMLNAPMDIGLTFKCTKYFPYR